MKPKELDWEKVWEEHWWGHYRSLDDDKKVIQSLLTQQRTELDKEWKEKMDINFDESCEKAETEAEIASKAYDQGYLDCQKGRKKAPHDTREGYCCACDYDLACFEGKLKEVRTELLEEIKKLKMEETFSSDDEGELISEGYNNAVDEINEKITNLLNKKDEK